MDALIENNEVFSMNENTVAVPAVREQVQEVSIEETIEKGNRILMRCFNMIRNIENIQPDYAFDEVCKLLLISVLQDRKQIEHANYWDFEDEDIIHTIFNNAKKYNSYKIFGEKEEINISFDTYMKVMSEFMNFNWADVSAALIFDDFLDNKSRNTHELITTPRPIIDYMVDILDPQEGEMICDPCCGNGGFLIESYEHLKKQRLNKTNLHQLANLIYGVDSDDRSIKNTKMKMFMHNIEGTYVYKHDGLLNNNEIKGNKFDVVLTNPPSWLRHHGDSQYQSYKNYHFNLYRDKELLFIERCLNLLKPNGRMGIIMSEGILFNERFKEVRQYIEQRAKIIKIVSLPLSTFSLSVYSQASIIFFQKFTENEVEAELDYNVLFADIKEIGITSKGNKQTNNQLILLAKEYKNTLNNPKIGNQILLKETNHTQIKNWSVSYLTNIAIEKVEKYSYLKLIDLLSANTEYINIENTEEYKRVTVKFYNNGVVLRDKIIGQDIGTKRQFRIAKGQLIVSKIGALDGAIGIVPDDLDNAIVTSDFLTYTVKEDIVLPEYLDLLLSSEKFTAYFAELSTGSVIKRLNTNLFLNTEIPVPTLQEQNELCQKIIQLKKNLKQFEQDLINEKNLFKNTLFES